MQFHTFKLDKTPSDMCIIVTPFGKFKCLRPPMGFLNSPSWAQAAMEESFSDMPDVEAHVNGVGIFSNSFEDHIKTVDKVLAKLKNHNFAVKASKCHWCQSQAPWLGHIITSSGILPNLDEIKPTLDIAFPKTILELWSFIGMVNFH